MENNPRKDTSGRLLCLLCAVCLVIAVGMAVSVLRGREAMIETGAAFPIAGISPEEIVSIRWTRGGESLALVRAHGRWALADEETLPVRQAVADGMARAIASLRATRAVSGHANPAACGLDHPVCSVVVELEGGETLRYDQGNRDAATGETYLRFNKNAAIYAVSLPLESLLPAGRAELISFAANQAAE